MFLYVEYISDVTFLVEGQNHMLECQVKVIVASRRTTNGNLYGITSLFIHEYKWIILHYLLMRKSVFRHSILFDTRNHTCYTSVNLSDALTLLKLYIECRHFLR